MTQINQFPNSLMTIDAKSL